MLFFITWVLFMIIFNHSYVNHFELPLRMKGAVYINV